MLSKKTIIKNRINQKLVVLIEKGKESKGLVFVVHGLGGFKEQKHIRSFVNAFLESGYIVVSYDATNASGESDGRIEDATLTQHFNDLEDLVNWSSKQKWYQEPFCLAGHSLGGAANLVYAQKHPNKVKAIAPISTLISGELYYKTRPQEEIDEWKKHGRIIKKSVSKPGVTKIIRWLLIENLFNYNLLANANLLTMPVLLIVGDRDEGTPPEHQRLLYDALPGRKELHIIKGAPHTFKDKKHLKEIEQTMEEWINSI